MLFHSAKPVDKSLKNQAVYDKNKEIKS